MAVARQFVERMQQARPQPRFVFGGETHVGRDLIGFAESDQEDILR